MGDQAWHDCPRCGVPTYRNSWDPEVCVPCRSYVQRMAEAYSRLVADGIPAPALRRKVERLLDGEPLPGDLPTTIR